MTLLEGPDGQYSQADWQPRQPHDPDWNTISVPDRHRTSGYTELPRDQVRLAGDTVHFALASNPSVDGQRLAEYPPPAELVRLLTAGHTISPGPPEPRTAAVADCRFWLLTDKPVGRDN